MMFSLTFVVLCFCRHSFGSPLTCCILNRLLSGSFTSLVSRDFFTIILRSPSYVGTHFFWIWYLPLFGVLPHFCGAHPTVADILLISFLAFWCNLVTSLGLVPPLSLNSPRCLLYKCIIDFAEVAVISQRVSFRKGSSISWHLITFNWLSGMLRKNWDGQQKQTIQTGKNGNCKLNVGYQSVDFGRMTRGQLPQAFMVL